MQIIRTQEQWLAINAKWMMLVLALEEDRAATHPIRVTIFEERSPETPVLEFVRPAPGAELVQTNWSDERVPSARMPLIIYLTDADGNIAMYSTGPEEDE